jgi:hypothetical protein
MQLKGKILGRLPEAGNFASEQHPPNRTHRLVIPVKAGIHGENGAAATRTG